MKTAAVLLLSSLCCAPLFAAEPIYPVVDARRSFLLGGSSGGKWLDAKTVAKALKGNESFRVYGFSGQTGKAKNSKPELGDGPCEETWFTKLFPVGGSIGLGGAWNALPRVPKVQSVSQPVYRNAVAAILKKNGIRRPVVKITRIMRVDLEGDGEAEVLICATNHAFSNPGQPSPNSRAGEYSLIALRKVVNGRVKTIMLAQEIYGKNKVFNAPNVFDLGAILDLNGDGKMEVVVRGGYYEGDWTSVFEIRGDRAVEVLASGCGA